LRGVDARPRSAGVPSTKSTPAVVSEEARTYRKISKMYNTVEVVKVDRFTFLEAGPGRAGERKEV